MTKDCPMDDDELLGIWYPYEGGATIGQAGPEGGILLQDEEFGVPDEEEEAHARLTLERTTNSGFTLTATLYGWMYLTRRVSEEAEARGDYERLRAELERLCDLFPYEEDGPALAAKKADDLAAAVADVEARFASA